MSANPAEITEIGDDKPTSVAPPVSRRELLAVAAWTVAADLLIFRSLGFSGLALFFALTPLIFWVAQPVVSWGPATKLVGLLIVFVAIRLVWTGSALTVFSGSILVVGISMSATGRLPYVLEGFVLASRALSDGVQRFAMYRPPPAASESLRPTGRLLAFVLPVAATVLFGGIFVLANPNLVEAVWQGVTNVSQRVQLWLRAYSYWELPFCLVAMLLGAGLIRPILPLSLFGPSEGNHYPLGSSQRSPLYAAYRNTLIALIVLFTVYLLFDFATLWKRDFPAGFYYAGYAHQGAAWLTSALALATVLLSTFLGGSVLRDHRQPNIRRLAWIWSGQNVLLAAAVYNRLTIYVGYNGMTQLRTVGFFGITLVVVGFVLVLYKIHRNRGFWWLIRRQLLAFVLAIILYSLFPVDYVAHRHNATAVARGYLQPAAMIATKPIDDEGMLSLLPATQCDDRVIRNGVLAMFAKRQAELELVGQPHWTKYQGASDLLLRRMRQHQSSWKEFETTNAQQHAINTFRQYVMKWY